MLEDAPIVAAGPQCTSQLHPATGTAVHSAAKRLLSHRMKVFGM